MNCNKTPSTNQNKTIKQTTNLSQRELHGFSQPEKESTKLPLRTNRGIEEALVSTTVSIDISSSSTAGDLWNLKTARLIGYWKGALVSKMNIIRKMTCCQTLMYNHLITLHWADSIDNPALPGCCRRAISTWPFSVDRAGLADRDA